MIFKNKKILIRPNNITTRSPGGGWTKIFLPLGPPGTLNKTWALSTLLVQFFFFYLLLCGVWLSCSFYTTSVLVDSWQSLLLELANIHLLSGYCTILFALGLAIHQSINFCTSVFEHNATELTALQVHHIFSSIILDFLTSHLLDIIENVFWGRRMNQKRAYTEDFR